jgi:hypothetical protein
MGTRESKIAVDLSDFSETDYLALNPDVAQAVARGEIASGRVHYEQFGRVEGRRVRAKSMENSDRRYRHHQRWWR